MRAAEEIADEIIAAWSRSNITKVIAAAQAEARAAALEEAAQVIDRVLAPPKRKEKYRILAGLIRALAARDQKPEGR